LDLATYERIAEPGYLDGLGSRSLSDLRAMRAECQRVEDAVSYLRRLVQGHLDILRCEQEQRAAGHPADLAGLVAALPRALADGLSSQDRPGRLPSALATPSVPSPTEELDALCDVARLANLPAVPDDELAVLVENLKALERTVSERRRILFSRLDTLSAELTLRYRTGAASVDALLHDEASPESLTPREG
jgi:hypothetical protein